MSAITDKFRDKMPGDKLANLFQNAKLMPGDFNLKKAENYMIDFDSKARDWDKEKMHLDRSLAVASELLRTIPIRSNMRALEYGAGTGLLSFLLKDRFSEITMMDSSLEMVNVTQEKIQAAAAKNMKALFVDLEKDNFTGEFDIIYNQMALHHVCNVDPLLGKFHSLLSKGGYLAIADLYKEDGSFHGEGFNGHNGFDVEELSSMLKKHGFRKITHRQCYILKKSITSGELRDFPIFLMTAESEASNQQVPLGRVFPHALVGLLPISQTRSEI